jgi:hypothetical protein
VLLNPEVLRNEVVLSKNDENETAWHMAAGGSHSELFE